MERRMIEIDGGLSFISEKAEYVIETLVWKLDVCSTTISRLENSYAR